jgi:hypothetical protein
MDGSDRKKLMAAGFRILRCDLRDRRIRELSPCGSWKLVSNYSSIAETERALAALRQDPKTICE